MSGAKQILFMNFSNVHISNKAYQNVSIFFSIQVLTKKYQGQPQLPLTQNVQITGNMKAHTTLADLR